MKIVYIYYIIVIINTIINIFPKIIQNFNCFTEFYTSITQRFKGHPIFTDDNIVYI